MNFKNKLHIKYNNTYEQQRFFFFILIINKSKKTRGKKNLTQTDNYDKVSLAITSTQRCLPKLCRSFFMLSCSESLILGLSSSPFNYNLLKCLFIYLFNNILISLLSKCKNNYRLHSLLSYNLRRL